MAPSVREGIENFPFPTIITPPALTGQETCRTVNADVKPLKNFESRSCRDAAVAALFLYPVN